MNKNTTPKYVRYIAFLCAICLLSPVCTAAVADYPVQPMASDYITSYRAFVTSGGGGKIDINYEVWAPSTMDDLGATKIYVYESSDYITWTLVKSYYSSAYPSMLDHNDSYYANYITYYGVAGRYYKASVYIWSGKDSGGDSRNVWTGAVKA